MALLNLIIAAIVDRAAQSAQEEQNALDQKRHDEFMELKAIVRNVFRNMDADQSGQVTYTELLHGYDTEPNLRGVLDKMDLGVEDLKMVYTFMDNDDSGSIAFIEFVDQLWKMKNMDSHMMLVFIRHHIQEVLKTTKQQTEHMERMQVLNEEREEKAFGLLAEDVRGLAQSMQLPGRTSASKSLPADGEPQKGGASQTADLWARAAREARATAVAAPGAPAEPVVPNPLLPSAGGARSLEAMQQGLLQSRPSASSRILRRSCFGRGPSAQ